MDSGLLTLPFTKVTPMIRNGHLSPVKLTEQTLERIERLNPTLKSFISVLSVQALADAEKAERQIQEGQYYGPLHGVPISIKDIICIKGVRCTAGSKILAQYVPDYDATAVKKIKQTGAVIVGTNNLHVFACEATSSNPFYGVARNPWDP